jgi:hypothetical protein
MVATTRQPIWITELSGVKPTVMHAIDIGRPRTLQAKQFGIRTCKADPDLPSEFEDSSSILVTSIQKLFNGLTRFGLGHSYVPVTSIVVDDAHACTDAIPDAFTLRMQRGHPAYDSLVALFESALREQGAGTFEDVLNGEPDAILPIPYWEWRYKHTDVARILSESGRMNNACAWFSRNYQGVEVMNIMIIPTKKLSTGAGFNQPVSVMRARELSRLTQAVRAFFSEFRVLNLRDVAPSKVQELLNAHHLDVASLRSLYTVETSQ